MGVHLIRACAGFCSLTGMPEESGNVVARLLWIGYDMCANHIPTKGTHRGWEPLTLIEQRRTINLNCQGKCRIEVRFEK